MSTKTDPKILQRNKEYVNTPHGKKIRKHSQDAYRVRLRKSVIEILGAICVQCGFSDPRALQIDHVNGGGNKERKILSSMTKYYKAITNSILANENKYQLLCANCNWIKKSVKGENPNI